MYKLSRLFILLMIAMLGVASCGDEPDGKWQKMKWTNVNNLMNRQGVYLIPEEAVSLFSSAGITTIHGSIL